MGQEAMNAADAAIERAMQDLLAMPDWNRALNGAEQSSFVAGSPGGPRTLPDGTTIDLTEIAISPVAAISQLVAPVKSPRTRRAPLADQQPGLAALRVRTETNLLPGGTVSSPIYVVVMVGDDPSETDGDPLTDGNTGTNPGSGVLSLRAEAFGPHGTTALSRPRWPDAQHGSGARLYRAARPGRTNRRARKSAVQTPGKALTAQQFTTTTGAVR